MSISDQCLEDEILKIYNKLRLIVDSPKKKEAKVVKQIKQCTNAINRQLRRVLGVGKR